VVRGYGEWLRHFFARSVAVNAHPGFNQQGKADKEHE
jgi:hypothetical protein